MMNPIKNNFSGKVFTFAAALLITALLCFALSTGFCVVPGEGSPLTARISPEKQMLDALVAQYSDAVLNKETTDYEYYNKRYTVPSYEDFCNAFADAKSASLDKYATVAQMRKASENLAVAHAKLCVRSDVSKLKSLYPKALEATKKGNREKYSPTSLYQVERLLDEAKLAIEDSLTPQNKADSITKRLDYAYDHLVVSPINPETPVGDYRFTVGLPAGMTQIPISDELALRLNNHINRVGNAVGCIAYDLESGFTVGFNHMGSFFAASTVKAMDVLYIYNKLIESGEVALTDVNRYMPQHHNIGAGSMQFSPYGTKYTLEQASTMAIRQSDNAAYYMLLDIYGLDGFNAYMKEIGCTVAGNLSKYSRYDNSCAYDAALVWKEIYTYTRFGKHGTFFRDNLINAVAPVIGQSPLFDDVPLAHKSGWSVDYYNDIALAYDEHPYMIAFYSRREICQPHYLIQLGEILGEIIKEYQAIYYK